VLTAALPGHSLDRNHQLQQSFVSSGGPVSATHSPRLLPQVLCFHLPFHRVDPIRRPSGPSATKDTFNLMRSIFRNDFVHYALPQPGSLCISGTCMSFNLHDPKGLSNTPGTSVPQLSFAASLRACRTQLQQRYFPVWTPPPVYRHPLQKVI